MISSIIGFIWGNAPLMYSIFTILFLIIIRIWTRNTDSFVSKPTKKIGDKLKQAGYIAEGFLGYSMDNTNSKNKKHKDNKYRKNDNTYWVCPQSLFK
jgi:hypothetical protein